MVPLSVSTNNKRTSDYLAAGSMEWKEGPTLPVDMNSPCAVPITPISFLMIYKNDIREFNAAIAGPTSDEGWREADQWPQLKTTRTALGCARLGQKVVISGGYDNGKWLT